jgi:hypothetical protein
VDRFTLQPLHPTGNKAVSYDLAVKKFAAFYGTRMFVTRFMPAH